MNGRTLVGRNVRRLRVALGLTQEALAVDAGLDRSYVGRIERATENPTVDVLDQLATALKVESCELLRRPEDGEPPPAKMKAGRRPKVV
ncbi:MULTISPECIES: helix-turn-helix domain-containing protein [Methylobacterium]|jgi:transcriptional regulator with XRE-family HTH domain|uniref:Transcriptional regulator, XRE family n=2 Tax=Methylobacterium TaxID=407 RepID=A0A0C6FS20_9HYPH|nr:MULTISPECIES: helix-turn-helix transcriptional regulator [Methylobacterium]BAQ49837.1 transcriptional regulator, XRE family [Methylobacterium aquaticum]